MHCEIKLRLLHRCMKMNEVKRQHVAAIFINAAKGLFQLAVPFAIVAFFQGLLWLFFLALAGLILVSIGFSWLSWYKFRYSLEEGELYVEQGVFVKKKRYIQKKRVQAINISAGVLQRIFGLVKVNIDTAGGGMEAEAELVAVTKKEADSIRTLLLKEPRAATQPNGEEEDMNDEGEPLDEIEQTPRTVWQLGKRRLVYTALTSSSVGLVLSAVIALLSQTAQFIPDSIYEDTFETVVSLSMLLLIGMAIVVLILSWFISSIITIVTYGNFHIETYDKEMVIQRGLLEKRQLTLAYSRITAIRVIRSVIRQPFGFVSVYVESAGGGNNNEQGSTLLVPLIHKRDLQGFLETVVPDYAIDTPLTAAPARAARRFFIRMLIIPVLLTAAAVYFWGWIGSLGLIVIAVASILAWFQYKDAGAGAEGEFVWLRYRTIGQSLIISRKRKIQSIAKQVSWLQKRKELATFELHVQSSMAGKSFAVKDISHDTSHELYKWYSYQESHDSTRKV
ncbi:hypothetical protein E2L03_00435 [Shouchella lehensis]|uniref:YdbS-like PH domain-containing protein n=2 Tax=Bacillaceae TaxID=186817 RepID=A0A4Y7WPA0_9BACI|nr:hypothetical protein E2L03_00435 [Shouchella lehensis]